MGQDRLFTHPSGRPLSIVVVGDVMLDVYRVGSAVRISPEAPVPVLLNPTVEYRLGGAGAVAAMCKALGADVTLIGVIGCDRNGEIVRELVEALGIVCKLSMSPAPRPTTTKERICGVASGRHRQQLARVDTESTQPISRAEAAGLAGLIQSAVPDVVILSDYRKGVCVESIVSACCATKAPVFVDPARGVDLDKYLGLACIVPNREEAGSKSARNLMRQLHTQAVVVKLDQDGCELATLHHARQTFPARARVVHDVTGAGDQFIATLTCARAAGIDWPEATELANAAAGLQVERHGCVPVTAAELITEMNHADRNRNAPTPEVVECVAP